MTFLYRKHFRQMRFFQTPCISTALIAVLCQGATAQQALPHDQVKPILTNGLSPTDLSLKYQPFLLTESGCVPYPAVDAAGSVSKGLSPTGHPDGECKSSIGQVYSRVGQAGGKQAIMYTWYFPKDQERKSSESKVLQVLMSVDFAILFPDGVSNSFVSAILWFDNLSASAVPTHLSVDSDHHWESYTEWAKDGAHPLLAKSYNSIHPNSKPSNKGSLQPLIAWLTMPAAARKSLQDYTWPLGRIIGSGHSHCSLSTEEFNAQLQDAFKTLH